MESWISTIFGTIAVCATLIGMAPQVFKNLKTKSTRDVSMLVLINYNITSISWLIYGMTIKDSLIIFSNAVGVITSLTLIFQKIYYDQKFFAKPF